MQSFTTLTSSIIPLPLKDIDTDLIIPAQHLTNIGREGYGKHLFERLREQDPSFPLNQEKFRNAHILVTRSNFGCGSSREHAVWALLDFGIRVVIAPSFADIFLSNSMKNGLLPIQLSEEIVESFLRDAVTGTYVLTVDLERQRVILPDAKELSFEFDSFRRECLLHGYDEIQYILSQKDAIDRYQKNAEKFMFYSTHTMNHAYVSTIDQ